MTTARTACCAGLSALLLASCSSPPKPPSVDEGTRRPVNARPAVDLKACQGDLSRATILVSELARSGMVVASMQKTPPAVGPAAAGPAAACHAGPETADAPGNLVAIVSFGMGSAVWNVDRADAAALSKRARGAAVILIRGRTDATSDSLPETALARRRAEAAAEFLLQAGVARDKLRLTWQGAGDPLAGRGHAERAQSRRVEIEFYMAAPVIVSLPSGTANGRGTTAASL